jgi:hypothetical protein
VPACLGTRRAVVGPAGTPTHHPSAGPAAALLMGPYLASKTGALFALGYGCAGIAAAYSVDHGGGGFVSGAGLMTERSSGSILANHLYAT